MDDEDYPKSTAAYYLPSDVTNWIEQEAKRENRSASNFLATLVRRIRDGNVSAIPN